jgi:hypothetical protein
LLRKANAVEEETKWSGWLYHQRNQSIHVTDGVTVTLLPASLLQKISVTMDCPWQITWNWKLSRKFKKLCKFSSRIKAKSCKMKSRKARTACIWVMSPKAKISEINYSFPKRIQPCHSQNINIFRHGTDYQRKLLKSIRSTTECQYVQQFIYFIHTLFNDAVSISGYTVLNGIMMSA